MVALIVFIFCCCEQKAVQIPKEKNKKYQKRCEIRDKIEVAKSLQNYVQRSIKNVNAVQIPNEKSEIIKSKTKFMTKSKALKVCKKYVKRSIIVAKIALKITEFSKFLSNKL